MENPQQAEPVNEPKNSVWQTVKKVLSYIFIDGMSGMAIGLFATLIIGTIIENIGKLFPFEIAKYFILIGQTAKFLMGSGIALGMGFKLNKTPLVCISAGVVRMLASFAATVLKGGSVAFLSFVEAKGTYATSVGEPLCSFIASFVALEVGSLVSGKTKVDIIITPLCAVGAGSVVALLLAPPVYAFITFLSDIDELIPYRSGLCCACEVLSKDLCFRIKI
jgi:uncharacterized membrane protein